MSKPLNKTASTRLATAQSKTLVIAEKPSVATDIARALSSEAGGTLVKHDDYFENADYIVTSAVGHLLEIHAPEAYEVKRGKWSFAHLPVIPPHFDLRPIEKTKSRLSAVVRLAKRKDVAQLINACDAGREGELIFRLIQQYSNVQHPVQRLWLQSMTPAAIRDGFLHLRSDTQMQGLAHAARSRSEADWLVGINGTRALTAFNSREGGFFLTTVGRVQTPTLSIVVEREEKIRAFVVRDYWEIHAEFTTPNGPYTAKWFDPQWKKNEADPDARADRLWLQAQAEGIAQAVLGRPALAKDDSKPSSQSSPLLFDLTSLQREANSKFGFSAKTTLALAQSLYEKHKALTYPRTDSRALPEDYPNVAKQTMAMLAGSGMLHLQPFAKQALDGDYVRPNKRIFDNKKVSDHFAIIPTTQEPKGLSEIEQKIYDLVTRRFMAVFFPPAEYLISTRSTEVALPDGVKHQFKTEGKVLLKPGWLAIYGKEAQEESEGSQSGSNLPALPAEGAVQNSAAQVKAQQTRPPARFSEATLLGAMEGAGKWIEDDELREAMQEKGLGTPATRSSIIEGLIVEKYMLREGREILPTAKAFQLITLLRGLGIEDLCKPELTGEWEYKLAQIEQGQLSRDAFMHDIVGMTERIVKKAKEYDRDTIPGDYATLQTPCPKCGGVVKENYRRFACTGQNGLDGCGFSFTKIPASRAFEIHEAETFLRNKKIGPLEGFRSKAGWPFVAEIALVFDEEIQNWKLEFDFGEDSNKDNEAPADFSQATALGPCPICHSPVYEHGKNYVCAQAVPSAQQAKPSCTFKTGKIILQQVVDAEQIGKLLSTGRTDLLDKFVSSRTRRAFKAALVWDEKLKKVGFEFEARKTPAKTSAKAATKASKESAATGTAAKTSSKAATKTVARKTSTAKAKAAAKSAPSKTSA